MIGLGSGRIVTTLDYFTRKITATFKIRIRRQSRTWNARVNDRRYRGWRLDVYPGIGEQIHTARHSCDFGEPRKIAVAGTECMDRCSARIGLPSDWLSAGVDAGFRA